jgi:GTP1/Obg family GTP-binding protein
VVKEKEAEEIKTNIEVVPEVENEEYKTVITVYPDLGKSQLLPGVSREAKGFEEARLSTFRLKSKM